MIAYSGSGEFVVRAEAIPIKSTQATVLANQLVPGDIVVKATTGRCQLNSPKLLESASQAQRFLGADAAISNLFNPGRQLVKAEHYRNLRISALAEWSRAVA